jgi:hypothetical protein
MLRAIAFCVDELGRVAPFEAAAWVRIYERYLDTWVLVRELPHVRDLDFLAGCLAVVGESVGSRVRSELERSGIGVWELPGEPEDLAEVVWKEEERLAA